VTATAASTPTPPPSATPLAPPAQPPAPQQLFTRPLVPGQQTTLTYLGPDLPIPQALASIAGAYEAVFFTLPNETGGQVYEWYPGISSPNVLLETGSQITIQVKPGAPATLSYPVVPGASGAH
jgi:hypothetical protein